MIVLDVEGVPAPKGSARAILIRGQARLIASGSRANEKAQIAWAQAVRAAARAQSIRYRDVPLLVTITFRLARPRKHYGTGRNASVLRADAPRAHTSAPDVDKLVRCTIDALMPTTARGTSYAGIIDDDSRVVSVVATKTYATAPHATSGARITIAEAGPL